MKAISDFCDLAACFFLDPLNSRFSPGTQRIACVITLLFGILTLGMAQAVSSLWRQLHPIEEENETHALISEQFRKVFGQDEILEDEWVQEDPFSLDLKDPTAPAGVAPEPVKKDPVLEEEEASAEELLRQFPSAELETIRASFLLIKAGTIFGLESGEEYVLFYQPDSSTLSFQERGCYDLTLEDNKLEMMIDQEGKIISLTIKQLKQPDHPEAPSRHLFQGAQLCLKSLLEEIYRETSHYSSQRGEIRITVIRKSIKKIPEFHLEKFSKALEKLLQQRDIGIDMSVIFLDDNLKNEMGFDIGGISRDYLDDLFEGIVHHSNLSFKPIEGSSLVLPQAKMSGGICKGLPLLDANEKSLYQEMGKLMMNLYRSNNYKFAGSYVIGRRFDEALFHAAFCLTAEEVDTEFEKLTLKTQLKMCQALLHVRMDEGMDLNYLKKRLDWLNSFKNIGDHQLSEAASSVLDAGCLPDELTLDLLGDDPDLDKIKQNRQKFKQCLIISIFSQQGSHGQLGAQLAPIHAFAQGIKSSCQKFPEPHLFSQFVQYAIPELNDHPNWDTLIHSIGYQAFSRRVQGDLDRQKIANQFKLEAYLVPQKSIKEIEKKIEWLQEWILDGENGATEDELKILLKFLTGSSSLIQNQKVNIKCQHGTLYPVPIAHTCTFLMELAPVPSSYGSEYNDHTKDNFIKSLKDLVLYSSSSSTFQMT